MSEAKLYRFLKDQAGIEDLVVNCYNSPHTISTYDRSVNLAAKKELFTIKVTASKDEVISAVVANRRRALV